MRYRVRRRDFFVILSTAPFVRPCSVAAQSDGRIRKIGMFWGSSEGDPEVHRRFAAFLRGLRLLGWTAEKNLAFEMRYTDGSPDRFPNMMAELVQEKAELIVTGTAGLAAIARKITSTIPILTYGGDLEGIGLVASVSKPGGNITGIQGINPELMNKRIGLLQQLVPILARLGVIEPITTSAIITPRYIEVIADAASSLGIQVYRTKIYKADEISPAFADMASKGAQAAIVIANPLSLANRNEIVISAARNSLPTMYESRPFATAGGLLSYGTDVVDVYRQFATYADAILRGAAPSNLPVQQPTKFELVINLRTAKALNLAIPPAMLAITDEVIE